METDRTDIEQAYVEQTATIIRGRLPLATLGFIVTFGLAWVFEHRANPHRDILYGVIFLLEISACLLAVALTRRQLLSARGVVAVALLTVVTIITLATSYHVSVQGEAEILGIALGYINVGGMLLFPWGGLGQMLVAAWSFAAYILAVTIGVRAAVPLELTIIGQAFIGSLTVVGAVFIERYRRGFLVQEIELRRINEALMRANEGLQQQMVERQHANEQTSALLDIARDISGPLGWHEILDHVQTRVARLLPCDRVATFHFDRDSRSFRVAAHYGIPTEMHAAAEAIEFRTTEDAVVEQLAAGRSVVINDVHNQNWLPTELLQRFKIHALIGVPLQVRGRTIGVMTVARNGSTGLFTSDQVRWLEGVCQHLALARESADFYETQREETRTAAGLAKLASEMISSLSTPVILDRLCRLSTELLDCDCSHTFLLNDKNVYASVSGWGDNSDEAESLRVLEVPPAIIDGMLSRLQHDTTTVIAGSPLTAAAGDGRGELCIALRRGEEIVGIQTAGYRRRARHFSRWQLRVGRRISEIASMALENARLFEQLGHANRLKSDFLATVSHEFRTPLNVILGYCDLLLEDAFGQLAADQTDTVERLRSNARQLLDLITATLDVSRLDGGKLPLLLQPVQVWNMVEEIDADTREVRERKPNVHLSWNLPTNLPTLITDRAKLKVILKNLIGNAVKFTGAGKVTVSVHSVDEGLEFAVTDTGIGVPQEVQEEIFEPFQQANGSIAAQYGGVGLGLYIVRRLSELLGGRVSLQSDEGKGSTFRVWIPLRHAVERPGAAMYAKS